MIDVIFLLLTFFIYSLTTMMHVGIMPVKLQRLLAGQSAEPAEMIAVTIDRHGRLFVNREPVSEEAFQARLVEQVESGRPPRLFLAMEQVEATDPEEGHVDRGPILIDLIDKVKQAGIEDFSIVGLPAER